MDGLAPVMLVVLVIFAGVLIGLCVLAGLARLGEWLCNRRRRSESTDDDLGCC